MKKLLAIFIIGVFFFSLYNRAPLEAASAPTSVVITYAVFSEREGGLFVARDQGFFRKHG